jgi:hypothetical protein
MGTRTVRLDDEAEKTLASLRKLTGLSISEVLKRGLLACNTIAIQEASERPFDVYSRLDLGEGGYALAEAKDAKAAVVDTIKSKHER